MKKKIMAKQKNDNYIILNLAIFSVVAALYFCAIWFLNRLVYKDYLYFCSKSSVIVALINGCIIIFSSFLITKNTIKWIKQNKSRTSIIFATIGCCLLMPFLFFKSGTIADEHSIKKINSFGNVTQEYSYDDITKVELGVQYGIQYDITFESGKVMEILSHEVFLLNSFGNGKNIVEFDKLVSEHVEKEIYWTTYMTPSNVRRFFTDKDSFNYFNNIFKEYY